MVKVPIGPQIKRLREQRPWSQQELADQLNVTRQTISKWERGKSYPDLESLVTLTGLFGVSADELLGLTQPVKSRSRLTWWLHRGGSSKVSTFNNTKSTKWYSTGHDRVIIATGLMLDVVKDLDPIKDAPFRALIKRYYDELIRNESGRPDYVFMRFGIEASKCLRENGIVLSKENSKRVNDIIKLATVRYI